ncbi:MAG TPA: methionine--tRNA ligase [Gammaproteobacteria bacterium]|nr:methionine--tRNA ligase [Gammaproteobacteria bacterium]
MPRRILVTNALFYANGALHLGHMIEAIQSDIWVRFQKMRGHECHYIGGDDAHGTPVMLRAREEGVTPEHLIEGMRESHRRDLADFHVAFDNYYTTHSPENREFAELFYRRLQAGRHITRRRIRQAYDEKANMFLPDRFIRGECPNCGTPDQYGDSCENCGATYAPADLKNPVSVVSGTRPVLRESEHHFFKLGDFETMLRKWTRGRDANVPDPHVDPAVANKLKEWFDAGLRDWDISRDAPYFGFEIPDAPGKYFYVWLDAPIGYMASFRDYGNRHPEVDFDAFWDADKAHAEGTELYHFIGKDITYFHTLFWPAMLAGAGFRSPSAVFVHGFLTVNGEKMSKSRGTFITARDWLAHLSAEPLRYYFAAKLGPGVGDIDLNLDDFVARVNSDLVGKYVNIASRAAGLLHGHFEGRLADPRLPLTANLFDSQRDFRMDLELMAQAYEQRAYHAAMNKVTGNADRINATWQKEAPWALASSASLDTRERLHDTCSMAIQAFRLLTIALKPVLPDLARKAEAFLNVAPLAWDDLGKPLPEGHRINPYEHLMTRIDPVQIEAMLEASRESLAKTPPKQVLTMETNAAEIGIEDFSKLDLRVARVAKAEHVEGADKLLRLEVELGGETRQVFAGIKAAYEPETLVGKLVVVVANLAPRKMRFGVSAGMVLAAGPGGKDIFLVSPDTGAEPGMKVK